MMETNSNRGTTFNSYSSVTQDFKPSFIFWSGKLRESHIVISAAFDELHWSNMDMSDFTLATT